MKVVFALAALCLVGLVAGESALLLAGKSVQNNVLAENQDMIVKYIIFNKGTSAATDVTLEDSNFLPAEYFQITGATKATWASIPAGGNVTHAIVVKPLFTNYFNFSSALVTYTNEDGQQETLTSAPGVMGIISEANFYREFHHQYFEWAFFLLLLFVPIGFPYFQYAASAAGHSKSQ
eukprot:m.222749 g.222749  ORF g.222749 m.222749 type:complete len:178 (+) comp10820_c0_seq1:191-724(+)